MDYTEWMDGPGGYREWYSQNVETAAKGPQTNSGPHSPTAPPPPPPEG